jgi:hypothetical protein
MRLLVHIEDGIPLQELARVVYGCSLIARSCGMETVITDRRDGAHDLPGARFTILYARQAARERQQYDLFIPRRPVRGPARIKRIGETPLLCGRDEPEFVASGKELGFDIVSAVFHLASGQEEYRDGIRDELGRLDEKSSFLCAHGVVGRPLVDVYIRLIKERIAAKNGAPPSTAGWPGGKKFALVLSHDIDSVASASLSAVRNSVARAAAEKTPAAKARMSAAALRRAALMPLRYVLGFPPWLTRMERGLELACRIEERYGVRSTFFVFSPQLRPAHPLDDPYSLREKVIFEGKRVRFLDALSAAGRAGWEVGLHGSIGSHADPVMLGRQRQALGSAVGLDIVSARQHYLRFENDATWVAQEGAGFSYDSTHGYNRLLGFRGSCCLPFRPFSLSQHRELDMWELPLNVQDCAVGAGKSGEGDGYEGVLGLLSCVAETGGVATVSWHLDRFSDPRFRALGEIYERVIRWAREKDGFVGSVRQVMEAWESRAAGAKVELDLEGGRMEAASHEH